MPRQKLPARVNGPYYLATRDKWRIRIFDAGRIEDVFFDSEKEARHAMASAAKKLTTISRVLSDVLGDYFAGVESGAAESAVATALGHGSFEITARHYAQPEALTDARSDRVAGFLDGLRVPWTSLRCFSPENRATPSLRENDHQNQ